MPIYKEGGKKDGLQRYRVTVSYTAPSGEYKQISRVAYGSDAARQLESDLRREASSGTASRMTVAELAERYIDAVRHDLREQTVDKKQCVQKCHILPTLGDERLDKLTPARLEKWKLSVGEKPLSLGMKRNAFKELRAILNYAKRVDLIQKSPLEKVPNFRDSGDVPETAERIRYYTKSEFVQYIQTHEKIARESGDWRYYVFFCVAFYTGMRKGEIHALKWSDITGDVIHVRRSIAQKLRGGDRETKPKNQASVRDLRMPDPLIKILNEHRARQERDPAFSVDWRVVGGVAPLRDTSIEKANIKAQTMAGLPHRTIHEFRHSHATLLFNAGVDLAEVSRRLGHSSIKETERTYAHLYPTKEELALAALNAVSV